MFKIAVIFLASVVSSSVMAEGTFETIERDLSFYYQQKENTHVIFCEHVAKAATEMEKDRQKGKRDKIILETYSKLENERLKKYQDIYPSVLKMLLSILNKSSGKLNQTQIYSYTLFSCMNSF